MPHSNKTNSSPALLQTFAPGRNGYFSRRAFLRLGALASAAAVLKAAPGYSDLMDATQASGSDLVEDTLNGLVAFVVPGGDAYSIAQGQSSAEPGGLDAGITPILAETLNQSTPYVPAFSATVAAILNQLALAVHPPPGGSFPSPFAGLSFAEKAVVFQIMDATPELKPLSGLLPGIVAFLVYSEGDAFDSSTRSLTGQPVGWTISNYEGAADGRDALLGYFENRRKAE